MPSRREARRRATPRPQVIDDIDIAEEAPTGPRVIYMGSPEFAVPALRSLVGAGFTPRLIVTPPPRRAGRGRRVKQVPLAQEAETLQLPLHRTNDVNGRASRDEIQRIQADLIITAGFGQKLGPAILGMPGFGCVNLHTSLLPKYRGASPVAAAIRDGATETGVSIFKMDAKMDHGPVLASASTPIGPDETTDDVTARLATVAADLLVRTIGPYLEGQVEPVEQDHEAATYVGRLQKDDGVIDWSHPASAVRNQIRAVTSWPGAQTAWQPKVKHDPLPLLVLESAVTPPGSCRPRGTGRPRHRPGGRATASTSRVGEGALRVLRVRPAGGRAMAVKDFLNSRRVVRGDRFVAPRPKQKTSSR